jgi:phospho-N-acetylmuramoyl-pentapeptide-transferase
LLPWLGEHLVEVYGPFRLLTSYLFLAGIGTAMAAVLTWFLLPKLWRYLPTDGGRVHAVGAQESKGKPVSAGLIFISTFVLVCLLVLPHEWRFVGVLACVLLSMLEGYLDDRTPGGWGEYHLGLADLGI